jgi:DNA-binding CsgD family transcriptional regulator
MTQNTSKNARRPKTLTPRELEILTLIARGHSNAEIARDLWITEATVKTHVRRLLERIGARTRAHAVALGFCHGLLVARRSPRKEVAS